MDNYPSLDTDGPCEWGEHNSQAGSFTAANGFVPRSLSLNPLPHPGFPMDVHMSGEGITPGSSGADSSGVISLGSSPSPLCTGSRSPYPSSSTTREDHPRDVTSRNNTSRSTQNATALTSNPQRPKRGRPPKAKSPAAELSMSVRRPVGRPRGTGPKQQAKAKAALLGNPSLPKKRPVGRPCKIDSGGGKVTVRILPGKISLAGSSGPVRQSSAPQLDTTTSASPNASLVVSMPSGQHLASSAPPETVQQPSPYTFDSSNTLGSSPSEQRAALQHPSPSAVLTASTTHQIIPDADPQYPVDLGDDEDDPEVSGEGLGDEDELGMEGDEKDDEEDPREETGAEDAEDAAMPHAHCAMPPWLLNAFKAKVEEAGRRNHEGVPLLYANNHTFWFPQESTFFLLQRNDISPQLLYNPRFFLWDPQALVKFIPCPNCKTPLQRHAVNSRPRRCVDSNSTFWIIGYRYRCRVCEHPKSRKHTVTFRSWDSRILAVLPSELAAEFPARLSHRSAISKTLFGWMRSCFQNGMGSKQFSDALRVQHLLKYDELHLQYLDLLARRRLDGWVGQQYEAFLPFDNASPRGFHGYIPGAQLIGNIFDRYIEKHKNHYHQHTSKLTCEICALDHSHKITKHISLVNGEQVFTALLTVTNEKGEIRSCNLVATKSQAQYEEALKRIQESLELYGHVLPYLCFTDNMADKQFLERCFPSLLKSVVPVEKYAHLEPLALPDNIQIFTEHTPEAINIAMRTILNDLPSDNPDMNIVIGFDSEWNVEVSGNGNVFRR